jgi:hypothetical protein
MPKTSTLIAAIAAAVAGALPSAAHADAAPPNLAGTYRCEPEPSACTAGQTFTVTQAGAQLTFKSDTGTTGAATLTSNVSLSGRPTWNSLGVILPDGRAIQWSNGTLWRKM